MLKHLEYLCGLPGPVGREELVQKYMEEQFHNLGWNSSKDSLGNLWVDIKGATGEKVAVVAHSDEIGFMVS